MNWYYLCDFQFFLGKMPVFRDWLRVIVIASIRVYLIYCNNFVDNPSGPVLCLAYNFIDYLSYSCAICWLKVKCHSCGIF